MFTILTANFYLGVSIAHWLVILSAVLSLSGAFAYIRDMWRGKSKPNLVTWGLWGFAPLITRSKRLITDVDINLKDVQKKKPHPIIFICGVGGSGKTTLANKLVAESPNAQHFELDWYLIRSSKERAQKLKESLKTGNQEAIDGELNPINWYDFRSFKQDITKLRQEGKIAVQNAWNQKTGEKDQEHNIDFKGDKGLIICDGDYLLNPEVISLADFSIFIEADPLEARKRGEERDRHRSDPEYTAMKRMIMEKYDIPYFEANKKNASFVLKSI